MIGGGWWSLFLNQMHDSCPQAFAVGNPVGGNYAWRNMGIVKYERMPYICFFCNHIDHILKQGQVAPSEEQKE